MADFLARLKQRKLVQWMLAYLAFAFALIKVIDVVADSYDWPQSACGYLPGAAADAGADAGGGGPKVGVWAYFAGTSHMVAM